MSRGKRQLDVKYATTSPSTTSSDVQIDLITCTFDDNTSTSCPHVLILGAIASFFLGHVLILALPLALGVSVGLRAGYTILSRIVHNIQG